MVQCMEAWILADPESLSRFYGKGFRAKSLPARPNLENEPKLDVYNKFAKATKDTSKGAYSEDNNAKIKHASALLALIDPKKVADRCPRVRYRETVRSRPRRSSRRRSQVDTPMDSTSNCSVLASSVKAGSKRRAAGVRRYRRCWKRPRRSRA